MFASGVHDDHLDRVPRPVLPDQRAETLRVGDRVPVELHDDVSGHHPHALRGSVRRQPDHVRPTGGGQVELQREVSGSRLAS